MLHLIYLREISKSYLEAVYQLFITPFKPQNDAQKPQNDLIPSPLILEKKWNNI